MSSNAPTNPPTEQHSAAHSAIHPAALARHRWLRPTLRFSRYESVATATTTAASDNFLNAFAVHLQASAMQLSWLIAVPQLIGAWLQLASIQLDRHFSRRALVVSTAIMQGLAVLGIAVLALLQGNASSLILLAVLYHMALNLNQPHWRAWLGSIVPRRRRGAFFAGRTRLVMLVSVFMFLGGGGMLSLSQQYNAAFIGFAVLFGVAAIGRLAAATLITRMHDPDAHSAASPRRNVGGSVQRIVEALRDPVFRQYSLFVAAMQGMVAVSAPFFALYMLRDLSFSYLDYSINSVASIATQFMMLRFWGRFADRYGNRLVMLLCSVVIPVLPLLWLFSPNVYYLLLVQVASGVVWSGFTLSTANYLYDIRPHQTHFATYAAVQASINASFVFAGALLGGLLAANTDSLIQSLGIQAWFSHEILLVMAVSGILRIGVALWFLPRLHEPLARPRLQLREIVYRVSRINQVSGVVLDWLTVARRNNREP